MKKINNIMVDDEFMATLCESPDLIFDIRKNLDESKLNPSLPQVYESVVNKIEECLFLSGLDKSDFRKARVGSEDELEEARKEIKRLKKELERRESLEKLLADLKQMI